MIVVLAVVAFVASVTFSSFPKMNSKLSLDLLTQDVALTVRQAQIYGTTVFGVGDVTSGGAGANYQAYGVSFPSPEIRGDDGNYRYTLFADVPSLNEPVTADVNSPKNRYDEYLGGANQICMNDSEACLVSVCGNPTALPFKNECLQRFIVSGRDEVSSLCLNYMNSGNKSATKDQRVSACESPTLSQTCDNTQETITKPDPGSSVDIVFRRPKLQASITAKNSACGSGGYFAPNNIGIVLKSDSGDARVVVVWRNGQISIDR